MSFSYITLNMIIVSQKLNDRFSLKVVILGIKAYVFFWLAAEGMMLIPKVSALRTKKSLTMNYFSCSFVKTLG
ncbi:MAG: hypothetical protein HRT52_21540 [Colwellia sp.]|nr:hypothetical protein [Colwellia sp.]